MLTDWAEQLSAALEAAPKPEPEQASVAGAGSDSGSLPVDGDLINLVLDLARDAAHAVDRPAAPLTTFLVGYAAGRTGGGRPTVEHLTATARVLAEAWDRDAGADGRGD
ncbi:MAG TPA: DUF6457 domain-containing protein [Actinopolymorphaceae bacterium]|nr:DUF6457 domain-containing protein [Actinopolymorphaceae bacterium]